MQPTAVKVVARDVNVYYGDKHALKHVNVDIPDKGVMAFIGPSGCGKSTFLRCINRMNDTIPGCRVTGKIEIDKARHLRSQRSTWCSCARASAWCSRSPTRSPSRSSRTWPMARAFTASHPPRPRLEEIVVDQPQARRPVRGGEGSPAGSRHRAFRRPAAAPVHRARHRRRSRGHSDGRALLGPRPDRHRQDRGADRAS